MSKLPELFDQLAQDARRLRVGQALPEAGDLSPAQVHAVQADLRFMLEQPGVTIAKVADALGDALPLVSAAKDAFADLGVTVVSIESAHGRGGWTRHRAAALIRHARSCSDGNAVALRNAWRERLAICTIDGGLAEEHAEQVALDQLENASLLENYLL